MALAALMISAEFLSPLQDGKRRARSRPDLGKK
ncbi:Protein of unknown function [Pyronema omphalodes CBS 100304]|uniref:Uncharacterized protein n=1 Tax=Pyronema omphalodes (strain CBS 100304) TaxID=1076935 RepID=U4LT60_PYROM|nr:Protein of unknown function [Pyronema omphalodes CBS 100304]